MRAEGWSDGVVANSDSPGEIRRRIPQTRVVAAEESVERLTSPGPRDRFILTYACVHTYILVELETYGQGGEGGAAERNNCPIS